jgi:hypothetical protein
MGCYLALGFLPDALLDAPKDLVTPPVPLAAWGFRAVAEGLRITEFQEIGPKRVRAGILALSGQSEAQTAPIWIRRRFRHLRCQALLTMLANIMKPSSSGQREVH